MKRGHASCMDELLQVNRQEPLFARINGYNAALEQQLMKYCELASRNGVILEGPIPNPTQSNLSYFYETMGEDFASGEMFIASKLKLWLPRMNLAQSAAVAHALAEALEQMRREGKTESMLRNAYVRFMCWLYFKFERIVVALGSQSLPKVLYQGQMTKFELQFLSILCMAGCDILAVQCQGDASYLKLDPTSAHSDALSIASSGAFPQGYSIIKAYRAYFNQRPAAPAAVNRPVQQAARTTPALTQRPLSQQTVPVDRPLQLPESSYLACPNAWMTQDVMECLLLPSTRRGDDPKLIYTCFVRREGVEDKNNYANELVQLQQRLKANERKLLIVDHGFAPPTAEEIQKVRRGNVRSINDAITDLTQNFRSNVAFDLQNLVIRSFMELLSEEAKKPGANPNRIMNVGAYLICWFRRCYQELFGGWKPKMTGCLIYLGACANEREALFLRFLSKLPCDVVLLQPDLEAQCMLQDSLLLVQRFAESMKLREYPREDSVVRIGTAASHAEQELNQTLYNNSGLYRSHQFDAARTVILNTTCDEVRLYWKQELMYRPNFSTVNDSVNMPVLFTQISGVRNRDLEKYWLDIKEMMTIDTYVVMQFPFMQPNDIVPLGTSTAEFFRNGKLQREALKRHNKYPLALLREETQEHILNKIQLIIDQKLIAGTGENGMEYQIIAVALSLKKDWLRMIQNFDFTKKNPKILCIHTEERMASREDAITLALLSAIGFDVAIFVPAGYQCLGRWLRPGLIDEHQNGEFMYDLEIPDFSLINDRRGRGLMGLFRKGS